MNLNKLFLIFIFFILILFSLYSKNKNIKILNDGIQVKEEPFQIDTNINKIDYNGMNLKVLKKISVKGRVLSKLRYKNEIAEYDFVLGWKKMSDIKILKDISIRQKNRWYFWTSKSKYITKKDIISESSNWHLVPKNNLILEKLKKIKIGSVIKLEGYLIEFKSKKDKLFTSSIKRDDYGANACEVMYVNNMEVLDDFNQ